MPEPPEVPIEHLHEQVHHHAQHSSEGWLNGVALTTAILAVFAAVAALLAGHFANTAIVDEIRASNQWAYFQAKSIKSMVIEAKPNPTEADQQRIARYKKEQDEISQEATEKSESAEHRLHLHEALARSITLFQVAIAVAAVSALTRKRTFWFVSLVLGAIGIVLGIGVFFVH